MTRAYFTVFPLTLSVVSVVGCKGGAEREPAGVPFVFVVETLSRSKGVPDAAREVLGETIKFLESARVGGSSVSLSEARLGLEGETRLRVECADPRFGRELYRKAGRMLSEEGGAILPVFQQIVAAVRSGCRGYQPHVQLSRADLRAAVCE